MANNLEKTKNSDSKMAGGRRGGGMGGGMGGGKPQNMGRAILDLGKYFGKLLPLVFICIILSIGSAIVTIMTPGITADMFELIVEGMKSGGIDMNAIGKMGLTLAIMIGGGAISFYLQGLFMTEVTQRTGRRFRTDIDKKINRLPLSYFDNQSFGDVLSRVTNDVDTISNSVNQSLAALIWSITLLIGLIIVMFRSSWVLALVAIATVPISLIIIMIMVKFSQKHFRDQQRHLGDLNGHIEEIYSGHEVVRAYSGEEKAKERFDEINAEMAKSVWKGNFLSGLMHPVTNFVSNLGLVAVCVVGGIMMVRGTGFGIKNIVAFMMYIRLFANPISQLAQIVTSLQSAAAASERVFEFLHQKEMSSEEGKTPAKIENFKGKVEFDNVSFGYNKDQKIIHNFSAVALPGQKIAIVGPTGAGKTTIVNLLMRFYETDSGRILIDGVPTSDMTRAQVHDLFGMVLQDTWLFEGTIKENIIYAKTGITDQDVFNACEAAGIDHLIRAFPNSYDMVLDDTANLSAGERQLITIARAIVEDAPMLILDEATSAVDTRTEILIQQAMDKLTQGRTSFIIAHRLSTIKNADLILVMKDGDIVEQGSHDLLMKNGGFYSELYKSQFETV